MPIGPDSDVTPRPAPESFVVGVALTIFAFLGSAIAAASAAAAPWVQGIRKLALHEIPNTPLDPSTAVIAALKGAVDYDDARDEARLTGIDAPRFKAMYESSGNPPGPMELVTEWRRGHIDRDRLRQGLRQGYLRNDWLGFFDNLRHVPLSSSEYMQAAVQGHLDLEDAVVRADHNGVTEADARMLYEVMGNPPGVMEMLHLWNRGILTESQVDQGIRESRYKNKYVAALKELRHYIPPPRTITTLLSHGAIDQATAYDLFVKNGLTGPLAKAYVDSAVHSKTASHKELTAAQVQELYVDRALTHDQAVGDLAKIGYEPVEANTLLELADIRANNKLKQQAVTGIRTLYVGKRIDRAGAEADLTRIGVEPDQRRHLLDLWEIEQAIPSKTLTIGQLNQAFKKGLIERSDFIARAVALGYTLDDAELLSEIDVDPNASPASN